MGHRQNSADPDQKAASGQDQDLQIFLTEYSITNNIHLYSIGNNVKHMCLLYFNISAKCLWTEY